MTMPTDHGVATAADLRRVARLVTNADLVTMYEPELAARLTALADHLADATPPARGGEGRGGADEENDRDFPAITAGNCDALAYDVETHGCVVGVKPEPLAKFLRHAARMLRRYDALLTERAAQSPPAGAGAPTDAEWAAAVEEYEAAAIGCGNGQLDPEWRTKYARCNAARTDLLALRDRERGAPARAEAELARWRDFDTWWQTDGRDQMPTEYAEPVDDALVAVKYPPPESVARRAAGGAGEVERDG